MNPHLKTFRVQFIGGLAAPHGGTAVLGERDVLAADIDAALREAANLTPPTGARACRLTADGDSEVAYRTRPDPTQRMSLLVKIS
jgi:hypothetical protein